VSSRFAGVTLIIVEGIYAILLVSPECQIQAGQFGRTVLQSATRLRVPNTVHLRIGNVNGLDKSARSAGKELSPVRKRLKFLRVRRAPCG